jgi:hypothetical protein
MLHFSIGTIVAISQAHNPLPEFNPDRPGLNEAGKQRREELTMKTTTQWNESVQAARERLQHLLQNPPHTVETPRQHIIRQWREKKTARDQARKGFADYTI